MALIVAFLVAALASPIAARVAVRLGVTDHPGPLKVQEVPVPYLGGVAVFIGLAGPVLFARPALLVPLALSLVLGLIDDVAELSAKLRLVCEVAIGCSVAAVVPVRGPVGVVITVAMVLVLLNATNLLDGLDGLASGVGAVSALGFAVVLHAEPRVLALALAGALAGFLLWNRPPAHIYLGDAGSYLVGTSLALLLATSFGAGKSIALASGCLLFVAVPVADTVVTIVRRYRAGEDLLTGDRGHVYDQLVTRGWTRPAATGVCISAQGVLVAVGVGITQLPAPATTSLTALVIAVVGGAALWAFTSPATWTG